MHIDINNAIQARYYLCIKAIRSAARPEPSQTTTGTGGSSVTYSKTARIVFVPPSITNATTGMLLCVSGSIDISKLLDYRLSIYVSESL